jgi:hypothetical protein
VKETNQLKFLSLITASHTSYGRKTCNMSKQPQSQERYEREKWKIFERWKHRQANDKDVHIS